MMTDCLQMLNVYFLSFNFSLEEELRALEEREKRYVNPFKIIYRSTFSNIVMYSAFSLLNVDH